MSYTLLRWFRQGVAAALDEAVMDPPAGPRARLTVGVEIAATGLVNQTASAAIDVFGPGDVVGLDGQQVVRTFPVAGTLDFEPSYFAHLEFDRPDLPWLFSPVPPRATPDALPADGSAPMYRETQTVTPWICLVVIEKRDGVTLTPATPLARLAIAAGADTELPLLVEAHAWAHVQITGDTSAGVATVAAAQHDAAVSRLVCPRRLEPRKSYLACVVPTFKAGKEAGLGADVTATLPDEKAWSDTDTAIELPVYYSWEFSTGDEGDFESLVRRLEGQTTLPGVGTRPLDISSPGFGLADRPAEPAVDLGGVLRVTPGADPPISASLAADLPAVLNADDAVAPPIYGRWLAAVPGVNPPAAAAGWVDALNLDPRYRAAAGLGTRVVQERQEDLMAAVWEQYGEIVRANQLLRQSQLAVAASEAVVTRHMAPLAPLELLAVTGPALGRIPTGVNRTARRTVRESCLPLIAVSGAFRRVLRARGPIERRLGRAARAAEGAHDTPALLPLAVDVTGVLEILARGQHRVAATLPGGAVAAPAEILPDQAIRGGRGAATLPADLRASLLTLRARSATPACTPLDEAGLAASLRAATAPDVAIGARVRAQIDVPVGVAISPRLDPIMATPEIPTPMIGPLQEFGQVWLLPGLSAIPPNTITIVEADAAMIEAYMVGLNHEMARELLWRGFPTDQRGTVFSRFWDRRGAVATSAAPIPPRDIPPIHTWGTSSLGANLVANQQLVLLIRGDLLQRYPRATIYLQRARWKRDAQGAIVRDNGLAVHEPQPLSTASDWDADAVFPSFSGRAGGDITFLGFPKSRTDVRGVSRDNVSDDPALSGDAGWFVVFQEQPTEPRFGLDAEGPAAIASWDDLSWSNVVTTASGTTSGHLKVVDTSTTNALAQLPLTPVWDGRSDSLAAILLRRAFRLFVHARDLVAQ